MEIYQVNNSVYMIYEGKGSKKIIGHQRDIYLMTQIARVTTRITNKDFQSGLFKLLEKEG